MTKRLTKLSLPIKKTIYKILLALVSVVIPLSLFGVSAPAYAVDCWGHSADWKSSSNGYYMFSAQTQCSQKIYYVSVTIYLQTYNWQTKNWERSINPVGGGGVYNANFYNFVSQYGIYVPKFYGINCRRILSYHGVVDYTGAQRVYTTYSQGQCF